MTQIQLLQVGSWGVTAVENISLLKIQFQRMIKKQINYTVVLITFENSRINQNCDDWKIMRFAIINLCNGDKIQDVVKNSVNELLCSNVSVINMIKFRSYGPTPRFASRFIRMYIIVRVELPEKRKTEIRAHTETPRTIRNTKTSWLIYNNMDILYTYRIYTRRRLWRVGWWRGRRRGSVTVLRKTNTGTNNLSTIARRVLE